MNVDFISRVCDLLRSDPFLSQLEKVAYWNKIEVDITGNVYVSGLNSVFRLGVWNEGFDLKVDGFTVQTPEDTTERINNLLRYFHNKLSF